MDEKVSVKTLLFVGFQVLLAYGFYCLGFQNGMKYQALLDAFLK
jgi:hypothetical protein